jgi:hypothetical protein
VTHEHLTDEQLSAHLDGEVLDAPHAPDVPGSPSPTVDERMAGCATCRRRLAALEQARALVRRPVIPVAPDVKAAAVRAAMAGTSPGGPPDDVSDETVADVAPVIAVRRAPRRRPTRELVATAAALVVLGLAVGLPLGLSHGGPQAAPSAALNAQHRPAAPTVKSPAGSSAYSAAGTTATGVDLGTLNSTQALRARVGSELALKALRQGSTSSATQNSSADAAAPTFDGAGLPATETTCLGAAREAAGAADPLVLEATATYDHTPALVVVVQPPTTASGATTARPVVVVARSGCRVLARTSV